ncbi:MAG: VOC family protein [Candidatus Eremiobacteraeota bacterium]|nr:VOC family protein [Candidatus Eremiobacteraeota bacterium]
MANPFAWVEIPVDDMERARRFYEKVFEVTLQRMPGTEFEMWSFDSDQTSYGAGGALINMPGYSAGKLGATAYFACEDCGVQLERAVAAGGRVHRPKTSIGPYGFLALVEDIEGNIIGLYSMN